MSICDVVVGALPCRWVIKIFEIFPILTCLTSGHLCGCCVNCRTVPSAQSTTKKFQLVQVWYIISVHTMWRLMHHNLMWNMIHHSYLLYMAGSPLHHCKVCWVWNKWMLGIFQFISYWLLLLHLMGTNWKKWGHNIQQPSIMCMWHLLANTGVGGIKQRAHFW